MKFGFHKDVSFAEEVEEYEEELVFRQDEAWKKSIRKTPLVPTQLSSFQLKKENNFTKDLHHTLEWMKNTRNLEKLALNVSERSREYESFFPTFTPSFLGNVITNDDLDRVLSEFQTTPQKKNKKKKKKKTLTKAESEATLTGEDTLRLEQMADEASNGLVKMFISEEHDKIIKVLQQYQNDIDVSMVSIKESKSEEWSVDTKTRFHGLLMARNDSTFIQCITVRIERLEEYKRIFENKDEIYGICYREKISLELATLLTPFSVDDKRWSKSVLELQQSKDWISVLIDMDESTFKELKELTDIIHSESTTFDQVLFPIAVAQNLRHASCLFDESAVREVLPIKEEFIACNSNVLCIMNCSAFTDIGDLLSLAQKEGFCLTGMHSVRINKTHIIDMFPKDISDQDFSLIRCKALKMFCHGPSIILSLHRHNARVTFNSLLEYKYEKSVDEPTIFSDCIIISPLDERMSHRWTTIFFPHGPFSEIKYTLIGNQLIHTLSPLYFHTTGGAHGPAHNRNSDFFTVVFLSISNRILENLGSWGDILSKIFRLKSVHEQTRIESCNLVNCSAKVAREIASGCDLDPLGTLRLIYRLRNGYCLMMRLSTTQALFNKLHESGIFKDPHVFYVPQLDGLYNRLNL